MDLVMMTLWMAGYDLPSEPPRAKTITIPAPVKKGCCKHCGKTIGRGLHFHERACSK